MARPSRTGGKTSAAKTRKAGPAKARKTIKTKPRNELAAIRAKRRSVSDPNKDLKEARAQQAAMAEILKVIASSPSDVQPVFEAIAARSVELVRGHSATVSMFTGDRVDLGAFTPISPEADAALTALYPRRLADYPLLELVRGGEVAQVPDIEIEPRVPPAAKATARTRGFRSLLFVPMNSENGPVGTITVTRREPGTFAAQHIQLMQTFADQAVIAIENVRLFNEVQAKARDLSESLEQQTATSEVLEVISASTGELEPVFQKMLENATRICGANFGALSWYKAGSYQNVALYNIPDAFAEQMLAPIHPHPKSGLATIAKTLQVVQIEDLRTQPPYLEGDPAVVAISDLAGARTIVNVPMLRENELIGAISIYRQEVRPFTDKQVELVANFAKQAVIAIENTRLLKELRERTAELSESLTYQTGSGNILRVIASSPTDVKPVLQAIVESACELCGAYDAIVRLKDGDGLAFGAHHGPLPVSLERVPISAGSMGGLAMTERRPVHVHDIQSPEGDALPFTRELARRYDTRTLLVVPLMRENESIGAILLRRAEVNPFTEKQIALLQTFADQAVIAIGNVRLFEEVQAKTRDLAESLQQQTATADVLKVISRSAFDLDTVLDTLVKSAAQLCEAEEGIILQPKDDGYGLAADWGLTLAKKDFLQKVTFRPDDGRLTGMVLTARNVVHIRDVLEEPGFIVTGDPDPARTRLGVPLLRDGTPIGVFVLTRMQVRPFTDRQIELVQTFAAQAVIAIENARLFNETKEALEQQTATSEVLAVISSSPGELAPVFQKMLENAIRVCGASFGSMNLWDGEKFSNVARHNMPPAFAALRRDSPMRPHPDTPLANVVQTHQAAHVHDYKNSPAYLAGITYSTALVDVAGARTILVVPMLKEGELIGTITIFRQEVRPFTDKQIALIENFTKQAVIAIENTRLLRELRERTDDLTRSLDDLRAAQDRLVQTEKLASLGQLTAGIAHEIKNPLNFVNNFSALSSELTDELNDLLKRAALTEKMREEVDELTKLLKENLEKVEQHGKRADSIVKNMLLHSREGSREHRPADINSLLDESLNLAYHGARAEKGEFNITLQRDFDADAGTIELFPQEITRAFLNLIANGVYAATRRKTEEREPGFEPTLRATTKNLGTTVEIRIRDNGTGIPVDVQEKIFNPFFTTKPAGEGTGLGLSMTHDIIVKQHGGRIDVTTEPGQFTEFIILLPRKSVVSGTDRGSP